MKGAANDLQLGGHPCCLETHRVIGVFIMEEIRGADADPCRGQAGQVFSTTGDGVRADTVGPGVGCKIRPPTESVVLGRPAQSTCERPHDSAVVQHRILEHLAGEIDQSGINTSQRQCSGQSTPGADPKDHDAARVDLWLCRKPLRCCIAVVECSGIRMLGGKAVVDRRHHRTQGAGQSARPTVLGTRRPKEISPAVNPQHGRKRRGDIARPVNAHACRRRYSSHFDITDADYSLCRSNDHAGQPKSAGDEAFPPGPEQGGEPQRTIDIGPAQALVTQRGSA